LFVKEEFVFFEFVMPASRPVSSFFRYIRPSVRPSVHPSIHACLPALMDSIGLCEVEIENFIPSLFLDFDFCFGIGFALSH
jgi:hypothetical protein